MATTLTKNYQRIATINLSQAKIYTYAKYTEQTISSGRVKTTYKIKSEYVLNSGVNRLSFSSATAKLDGTSKTYGSTTITETTTIQELTRTITHNEDGTSPTKSISTSWSATYGGSGSSSGSIKAPTKNVKATVTSATSFTDTSSSTNLSFTNPSNLYVRPFFSFFDKNGVRLYRYIGTIAKHSSPITQNFSTQMSDILQALTTNANISDDGTITYRVREGLRTFTSTSESSYIADSENYQTTTFTITNAMPTITNVAFEEQNANVITYLGSSASTVIQNVSQVQVTVVATALKSATISKVEITNGSQTKTLTTSPYVTTFNNITDANFKVTVTDSRGASTTQTYTKDLIEYQPVKQNSFSFEREGSTNADVNLQFESTYQQQEFGSTPNEPTVRYKIGESGTWVTLTGGTDYTVDTVNNKISADYTITNAIPYTSSNVFYLEVKDLLTSWNNYNTITKGIPVMEWGDNEVQINGNLLLADSDRENVINVRDALGGGGGTTDYSLLTNKPQINGVTLSGDLSTSDIGITIPTQTSQLTNNSGFITNSVNNLTNYTKTSDLGDVALSNDYDDLNNKPTIPEIGNAKVYYGTSDTEETTSTKIVNCDNFVLETGATISVKFTNGHDSSVPYLNVNNTGAKKVVYKGAASLGYDWSAGQLVQFVYDGTNYTEVDKGLATTTYYGITKLSDSVSSTSRGTSATPYAVKQAYDLANSKQDEITSTNKLDYSLIDNTPTIPTNYVTTDTTQDITGAKTFKNVMKVQNGQGTGSLWIGGDVNANTLTNNTRHLARLSVPSYSDITLGATLLGFDSSGDTNMNVTNKGSDVVSFGGMKKITNATSPMAIGFCVANTRNGTTANQKVYPLEMDSNEARFNVQPNYNGTNLATVDYHDSTKQDTLVSGTNIKTINGTSLLGSGNITIGGGGTATDVQINGTSITSGGTANILTNGTYSSTNKIATISDVPTQTSDLTNDSGFITSSDLPQDSGWINITTSRGTWLYCRYRIVGKQLYLEGRASSLSYSGSSTKIGEMPSGTLPSTGENHYFYGHLAGGRIARILVNTSGEIIVDWARNISDGNTYTSATWYSFSTTYFIN